MRLRPLFLAALLAVAGSSFAQAKPQAKPALGNHTAITAKRLRAHLEFIAHDLLEGRDTPSRGLDIAAQYIAAQMKLFGLEPGGVKGTYFQPYAVKQIRLSGTKSRLELNGKHFEPFAGFIPSFSNASGKGNVVFIGHGYRVPSKGVDPFKGQDVRGKLILRVDLQPKEWNWTEYYERKLPDAETPVEAATKRGAVGVLTIMRPAEYDRWPSIAKQSRDMALPGYGSESFGGPLPEATISAELGQALLEGESTSFAQLLEKTKGGAAGESFALADTKTVSLTTALQEESTMTNNVVAILRGSDPKLQAEYVAIGSHYDHVGIAGNAQGDRIFNGADDDGSGTVAMIEMANALATGPRPKRSVIFVWHSGEEKGLWGSDYFTKNPTVPIKSIVAQLNIDMIGRSKAANDKDPRNKALSGPDTIYVIGSRKLSNDLGNILTSVNNQLYKITYDYLYDAPNDPENFYSRSDHYNYARFNIPIAFFFSGVHEDYHQLSDEVSKIDFRKIERISRTICATAFTIANRAQRPKLDKK